MWKALKSVLGAEEKPATGELAPAREALAAHDVARAREILAAAEVLAPKPPEEAATYLLEVARLWRSAGDPKRARAALETALALPVGLPKRNDIELALVRAAVDLGELDDAVARGETLLAAATVPRSIDRALAVAALADAIVTTDPARVSGLADDSVAVLLALQHVELADLIVLRAIARASSGQWPSLLGNEVSGLDEVVFTRLADAAIARATRGDPAAALAVLGAIRDQIIVRNAHDPCLIRLVQTIGETARAAGDHEAAIDAWDWLLVTHDNRGREKDAHAALLELCASYCDADRFGDADLRYQEALVRARGLGAATMSRTHREVGLFEAARGDLKKAEAQLQRAIETGLEPAAKAEAQIALGALLAESDAARARGLLEAGIAGLPEDHDDAVFAREQLATLA
jgi:tetratricopeptide (TPR) repeat protein